VSTGLAVLLGFGSTVVLQAMWAPSASAAQTSCVPDPAYGQCVAFAYTGADQTFALPTDAIASNVLVKVWGAGGGGTNFYTHSGGGGGYSQGVMDMTGVVTATVIVATWSETPPNTLASASEVLYRDGDCLLR
jgi:hypothetical protein